MTLPLNNLFDPISDSLAFALLFVLYAEVHYRLKGLWSRLYQREPEIIADAPHRCEPGIPVPVLLLVKDAHQFPVIINHVRIEARTRNQQSSFHFGLDKMKLTDTLWSRVFQLRLPESFSGPVWLDVFVEYSVNGCKRMIRNDNYRLTSHAPLFVNLATESLPRSPGWIYGDFHCHSDYTNDQVEFGAPLRATRQLASAIGLNFFCATDHSYDLDDHPDDYLRGDPELRKWQDYLASIERENDAASDFVIIPGEEVSIGNRDNRNVHLLVLNHEHFLPGSGDGAEKWFRTEPELSINSFLPDLKNGTLTFAAHPEINPPLLERWLVRRDKWHEHDYLHSNLKGLQIWNGCDNGFSAGRKTWCKLLLAGRRIYISAGNDAHGNFNRFRQIAFPFMTMREHHDHLFGKIRTALYIGNNNKLNLTNILGAINEGRMLITSGPFIDMSAVDQAGEQITIGGEIQSNRCRLRVNCMSTKEYGPLTRLKIYHGEVGTRSENVILDADEAAGEYSYQGEMEILSRAPLSYLRAELYSTFGKCFTNPIWLKA